VAKKAEVARAAGVHLVLGEDSYLAEEALEQILAGTIGAERNDALTVLQGDEVKWEAVVAAARSGSLFATRRAVVVRRADMIRGPKADDEDAGAETAPRKGRAKGEEDPVLRYLDDPSPDVTIVLLAVKPDRRRNPWKRLSSEGTIHPAEPKKGSALRAHVDGELRRRGLRLDADAVAILIEEVGQDLRRLMGEVDKLEAWGDGRATLSADDVQAVLGRGLGRPLYLLADAVSARNVESSLEKLEELLDGGEEGLRILVTLHRSLRQVRAAAALLQARVPRPQIAEAVLPPNMQWKLDSLLDSARRWKDADLRRALAALDRADRRMKKGADAATTLVAALAEACGAGDGAATSPRRGR
jgi:DNA polymerase-3 subunit delta